MKDSENIPEKTNLTVVHQFCSLDSMQSQERATSGKGGGENRDESNKKKEIYCPSYFPVLE